jgi:hypothetical protein
MSLSDEVKPVILVFTTLAGLLKLVLSCLDLRNHLKDHQSQSRTNGKTNKRKPLKKVPGHHKTTGQPGKRSVQAVDRKKPSATERRSPREG